MSISVSPGWDSSRQWDSITRSPWVERWVTPRTSTPHPRQLAAYQNAAWDQSASTVTSALRYRRPPGMRYWGGRERVVGISMPNRCITSRVMPIYPSLSSRVVGMMTEGPSSRGRAKSSPVKNWLDTSPGRR